MRQRNDQLDGVRGIAVVWVMIYHLFTCRGVHPWLVAVPVLRYLAEIGWVGVMLFFGLSGYLITSNLVATKGRTNFVRSFLTRRCARIVPAYALLLLSLPIGALLWPPTQSADLFGHAIPTWSHIVFAQNAFMAQTGYLGNEWLRVTWSLAVEVQFYVCCLLLVIVVPRDRLRATFVGLAIAAAALRWWIWNNVPGGQTALVVLMPCRMDSFALGGLVALAPGMRSTTGRRSLVAGTVAGSLLFVAFSAGLFGRYTHFVVPLYYTFLAIASAAVVGLAALRTSLLRFLEWPWIVNLGRTSYFLYLFHMPVAFVSYELLRRSAPEAATSIGAGTAVVSAAACWVLANVSYRWLEAPVLRWAHLKVPVDPDRPLPAATPPCATAGSGDGIR